MRRNIFQVNEAASEKVGKYKAIEVTSCMPASDSFRSCVRDRTRKVEGSNYEGLDCHPKGLCSWQ